MTKSCSNCKKISEKLIKTYCRLCYAKHHYTVSLSYKGKCRKNLDKYRKTMNGKFKEGIRSAKRREIFWDLTLEQYEILIKNNVCHYGNHVLNGLGVSLDRTDNSIGYTLSNVVPCCKDCNRIKSDRLSYKEMVEVAKLIDKMRSK